MSHRLSKTGSQKSGSQKHEPHKVDVHTGTSQSGDTRKPGQPKGVEPHGPAIDDGGDIVMGGHIARDSAKSLGPGAGQKRRPSDGAEAGDRAKRPRRQTMPADTVDSLVPAETGDCRSCPGIEAPAESTSNGCVSSCCANCAMYYSVYPDLVCCRPQEPEGPCLLCMVHKKGPCVQVKALFQTSLRALENAARLYSATRTAQNLKTLEDAQMKFDDEIKDWRNKKLPAKTYPIKKDALQSLCLRQALKQMAVVSPLLLWLRCKPLKRHSLEVRESQSLQDLQIWKLTHLEAAAGHLIGDVMRQSCERCSGGKGLFCDCIMVASDNDYSYLNGKCTNCSLNDKPCSLTKVATPKLKQKFPATFVAATNAKTHPKSA